MKFLLIAAGVAGFLVGFACEPSDAHFSTVFGPLKAVLAGAEPTPIATGATVCRVEAIDRVAVRIDEIAGLQPAD